MDPNWNKLDQYLTGELDASARAAMDEARVADPALDRLARAVAKPVDPALLVDPEVFARRVDAAIDAQDRAVVRKRPFRNGIRRKVSHWMIGTATALLVVAVVGVYQYSRSQSHTSSTVSYTTVAGEQRALELPDGTRVQLAPLSTLDATGRSVSLTGEAVFTVVQHASTPFVVRAGDVETRVLGTRFGVKAYPDLSTVRVVVTEGKVSLGRTGVDEAARAILTHGHMAEWSAAGIRIWPDADTLAALAWQRERLVFIDAPLSDVAAELERWYGISVVMDDNALQDQRVTANIHRGDLPAVLDLIMAPTDIHYSIQDTRVVLSRR